MEILAVGYIASWILTVYLYFKVHKLKERNDHQRFTIENLVSIINKHSNYKVEIGIDGYMRYEPGENKE